MYQVSSHLFRPNTNIAFAEDAAEFLSYVKENYVDTGKVISFRKSEFSDNTQLILKITTIWRDQDAYQEWMTDPVALENGKKKRQIMTERGITVLTKEMTVI